MKAEKIFLHGGTSWVAQSSQYRYYYVDLTVTNDEWPHHVYFNVTTNTPGAQVSACTAKKMTLSYSDALDQCYRASWCLALGRQLPARELWFVSVLLFTYGLQSRWHAKPLRVLSSIWQLQRKLPCQTSSLLSAPSFSLFPFCLSASMFFLLTLPLQVNASAIMTWPPLDRYYIVVHTQSTTPTVFFGSVAADCRLVSFLMLLSYGADTVVFLARLPARHHGFPVRVAIHQPPGRNDISLPSVGRAGRVCLLQVRCVSYILSFVCPLLIVCF
jgi:hypothetical protein